MNTYWVSTPGPRFKVTADSLDRATSAACSRGLPVGNFDVGDQLTQRTQEHPQGGAIRYVALVERSGRTQTGFSIREASGEDDVVDEAGETDRLRDHGPQMPGPDGQLA